MNDLIQRIVNAIFRMEGMHQDYKNPGNLRGAPWLKNPVVTSGFWQPVSRAQGIAGAAHVVALHIAQGNNLTQLISSYAPSSENNTKNYIEMVKLWAQIPDENVTLSLYL